MLCEFTTAEFELPQPFPQKSVLHAEDPSVTPEELNTKISEEELEVSFVSLVVELDRSKLLSYIGGDVSALADDEIAKLNEKLNVSDDLKSQRLKQDKQSTNGVISFLRNHSVHFQYEKSGARKTASGTLVQIEDHLFVATCRHTIPQGTQFLVFLGEEPVYIAQDRRSGKWASDSIEIIGHARHKNLDIGYIELSTSMLKVLKREAIGLTNISVRPQQQYGRFATLYGFPFAFERQTKIASGFTDLGISSLSFPGPILAPEEWPSAPTIERQFDENIDVLMRYRQESIGKFEFSSLQPRPAGRKPPDALPDVHGMSGGGIWQSWKFYGPEDMLRWSRFRGHGVLLF